MLYYLSPCAFTTAKWLGDERSLHSEVADILATAVQMQCCERFFMLPPAKPNNNILWWRWASHSAYHIEWLISLYESMVSIENQAHFRNLAPYKIVNTIRTTLDAFPTEEFANPLNPVTERERYVSDVTGCRMYKRLSPPFWLLNRQKVVGFKAIDPEPEIDEWDYTK